MNTNGIGKSWIILWRDIYIDREGRTCNVPALGLIPKG